MSSALASLLQELEAVKRALLDLSLDGLDGQAPPPRPSTGSTDPQSPEEDQLGDVLRDLRRAVLSHPGATRAVVSFLVGEGRAYALRPEGRARYAALVGSPELARLRTLWEAASLNLFDDLADPGDVPVAWTELIRDLLAGSGIDRVALALRPEGLA